VTGSAFMLCFGLGTVPALLVAGTAAEKLGGMLRRRSARWAVGTLLIIFGVWTLYAAVAPSHGEAHPDHAPHHSHATAR
jgi:sulfite exporter TauE/SafE